MQYQGQKSTCIFCKESGHVPLHCPRKKAKISYPSNISNPLNIQPIESLSPYIGSKWSIKARATDKTPVRTWSNARSQGKLFSVTLIDQSGPIRATFFQDAVDKYFDSITEGDIYQISGGLIKTANKIYNSVNCEYELTFDKDCEFQRISESDPTYRQFPLKVFNFVPVITLTTKQKGNFVDVLGVVTVVRPDQNIITKQGQTLNKRSIVLADETGQVDVTLWEPLAQAWDVPVGEVIGLKAVRIAQFNNMVQLSVGQASTLDRDPPGKQPAQLLDWFKKLRGTD